MLVQILSASTKGKKDDKMNQNNRGMTDTMHSMSRVMQSTANRNAAKKIAIFLVMNVIC